MASKNPRPERPDSPEAPKSKAGSKAKLGSKVPPSDVEDELEDALEQTFPASDPIAMQSTLVPGSRH